MRFESVIDWCKRVWLRRVIGYDDQRRYWDKRWGMRLIPGRTDYTNTFAEVQRLMDAHECENILEIGCGRYPLSALPGYMGLDFSIVALKDSGLRSYICADITDRIPLPDKSADAVYLGAVLLHVPYDKIARATAEIARVAKKCVILDEPRVPFKSKHHCFFHEPRTLFNGYPGKVHFIGNGVGDAGSTDHRTV